MCMQDQGNTSQFTGDMVMVEASGEGCFGLLAIIFVIWLIASFWKNNSRCSLVCCGLAALDFSLPHLARRMLNF